MPFTQVSSLPHGSGARTVRLSVTVWLLSGHSITQGKSSSTLCSNIKICIISFIGFFLTIFMYKCREMLADWCMARFWETCTAWRGIHDDMTGRRCLLPN
jgi:hypothetical protein